MARKVLASHTSGSSEIVLWENDMDGMREYELVINGVFIMASYNHLSSELLVRNVMKPGADRRVLIGGLGMGYTVKEACSCQDIVQVDVVEIEPVIIAWNRTWFKNINRDCLADERVKVIEADFYDYVRHCENYYDLVSMDIDNGPMMLVNDHNSRVYRSEFFREISELLKPGGIFAIWSCDHDADLASEAAEVFRECQVHEVTEEHNGHKIPYYIYFCYKG